MRSRTDSPRVCTIYIKIHIKTNVYKDLYRVSYVILHVGMFCNRKSHTVNQLRNVYAHLDLKINLISITSHLKHIMYIHYLQNVGGEFTDLTKKLTKTNTVIRNKKYLCGHYPRNVQ